MGINKLFYKLFLTFILLIILFCSIIQPAAAMSELAGEGLDLAAEIANGQDATAGMKKYTKDKYSDWMWEAAGGYETLLSGVEDSFIEQVKDKFDKIQTAIDLLSKLALAIDSGNYDEGLYHMVEAAVSVADHPLVNATWAAAKLTYKSHVMVVNTEAERQIEVLFNQLHKDRRLFTAADGEMKQIPINKETVDYFFNEYIVTDFEMRGRVKDYVEVRLNETWPEESWGSWLSNLKAIGSGVDTSQAEETVALQGEYRNVARGWIKKLMEDVNLEAQRWYSQYKLRKLRAEFEQFRSQFTVFNNDIEGLLRDFLRIKEIKAKEDFYNEFLVKSDKAYSRITDKLGNSGSSKRMVLLDLYEEAGDFKYKVMVYQSQLQWAGMEKLSSVYLKHYRKWIDLRDRIHNSIPPVVSEPEAIEEIFDTNNVWSNEIRNLNHILIGDLLEQPSFIDSGEIEKLKKEFKSLFKEGDISGDRDTLFDYNAYDNVMRKWSDFYSKGKSELQSRVNIAKRRCDVYRKGGDIGSANKKDIQIIEKINSITKKMSEEGKGSDILRWYTIMENAPHRVYGAVYTPGKLYLDKANNWFADRIKLLEQKESLRQQQYAQINDYLYNIRNIFLSDTENFSPYDRYSYYNNPENEVSKLLNLLSSIEPTKWLSESEKQIEEYSFIDYQGVSGSILKIPGNLEKDAKNIAAGGLDKKYIYDQEVKYEKHITQAEKATEIWRKLKLPTAEESKEIRYLVDKEFSLQLLNRLGNKILSLKSESAQIKAELEKHRHMIENDMENRKDTADWLKGKAYKLNIFFSRLAEKNMIDSNLMSDNIFKVTLHKGYAYIGSDPNNYYERAREMRGMILAMETYPHLMQSKELDNLKAKMTDLKTEWTNSGFYNFYKRYAPETFKKLKDILNLKRISDYGAYPPIKAATEKAIVHPALLSDESSEDNLALVGFEVIKESNLTEAEEILKETAEIVKGEVDENYRLINEERFIDNIRTISKLLPLTTAVKPVSEDKDSFKLELLIDEKDIAYLKGHELAEKYKLFAENLRDIFYEYHHRAEEEYRKESERLIPYDELAYKIEGAIDSVEFFIREKDYENALLYEEELEKLKKEHRDLPGEDPGSRCPELLEKLETLIKKAGELMSKEDEETKEILNKIEKFYDKFTQYYQSQDEFAVLSLLADDWEAADGTTLWDLEETLVRNFRVFDEISYQISNLNITDEGANKYLVRYDLKIISEIYDRDIVHEELSSVREIIKIDESDSAKIIKTLGGRFWKE